MLSSFLIRQHKGIASLKLHLQQALKIAYFLALLSVGSIPFCRSAFFTVAFADEAVTPDKVVVSTPIYEPNMAGFSPPLGTYNFNVAWQGIPAASLTLAVEQEGLYYHLTAKAKTATAIDLFYRLRYRAEGIISAVDLMPLRTTIEDKQNSKERLTEINYLPDGSVHAMRKTKGEEAKILAFKPDNLMLEPFSAAFLARSLDWQVGQTKEFDTFNGKSRYLIKLTAVDRTEIEVNDHKRDVWVIKPTIQNLTNMAQNKKLRDAEIYVSADDKREILEIRSEVFIGSVTTSLESYTPSANSADSIRMAQMRYAQKSTR